MKQPNLIIKKFKDAPIQIIDGDRGSNYPVDSELLDEGYCLFLNTGNVTTDGFNFNTCQFVSADKDSVLRKGKLTRNDLVMTTRGTIGNVGFYNERVSFDNIRINSGMVIFRTKPEEILPAFLYQYLRSPYFNQQVNTLRTGAAQPQLPIRDIKCIKIQIPELNDQEKIADRLSVYDDLIDNNRKRIQLLEESARLLFREWFVYFRFPGHEKVHPIRKSNSNGVKVVDGVPEGWKKRRLVEVADIAMGQSPKSVYYNDNGLGLPFHQGVTGFGDRFPRNQIYCTQKNRMAQAGDILFSVRAPVGRINISTEKIIIGRGLSAIRSKENHQSYLFYELKNHFFKEDMIGGGAIFAAITKKDLENVVIIYPDERTIEQFEKITNPIDRQINILSTQNQKLAQARDLLLPRLMSGAIDPIR